MDSTWQTFIAHVRKSGGEIQTLERHLANVAVKAGISASKIKLAEQGELIGLVHDLGKYSKEFQAYIRSATELLSQDEDEYVDAGALKGRLDHSTAGAQLIWHEFTKRGGAAQVIGQILAMCVASHHSGLIDCISTGCDGPVQNTFAKRMNKQDERTHLQEIMEKWNTKIALRFRELIENPSVIDGLRNALGELMKHDARPNQDPRNNVAVQFKIGLLVRLLFSCLIDADRLDTTGFEQPKNLRYRPDGQYAPWPLLVDRLENGLMSFGDSHPIDRIRRTISSHCLGAAAKAKGFFTLSVPTGGGKTLASLRFALHHAEKRGMDRIIYVIPYTSIIDQNAKVVRDILEPSTEDRGTIVLEHHSNLTPERQGWKEKMLSENWDSQVVFTTSVQLLETLFGGGTRGARRMHQLANSVLIFDEIQTLPINSVHLFNNAINFLVETCGSTVVLCTATQPLLDRVNAERGAIKLSGDAEIMPDVNGLFDELKRVEVINQRKPGGWSDAEIRELALSEVENSGSCLIITNTKNAAQSLYRQCAAATTIPVYHLSTNMCPAHRRNILKLISRRRLDRGLPTLCISTQLIEAGVDVDFGSVIRFTAGLDSIAQAAGRCNRNGRRQIGRVHVVNPAAENLERLHDIRKGKEVAERLLDDMAAGIEDFGGSLVGPRAMERYYEYYFFNRRDDMIYPVTREEVGRDDSLLNMLSVNDKVVGEYVREHGTAPDTYLRQSFMAAAQAFKVIDAPTRGLVVPYGKAGRKLIADLCAAYDVEKQIGLLRRAQQYTVNVFPHVLAELQAVQAVHSIQKDVDILYLSDARYYSLNFGLGETPDGNMEVLYV